MSIQLQDSHGSRRQKDPCTQVVGRQPGTHHLGTAIHLQVHRPIGRQHTASHRHGQHCMDIMGRHRLVILAILRTRDTMALHLHIQAMDHRLRITEVQQCQGMVIHSLGPRLNQDLLPLRMAVIHNLGLHLKIYLCRTTEVGQNQALQVPQTMPALVSIHRIILMYIRMPLPLDHLTDTILTLGLLRTIHLIHLLMVLHRAMWLGRLQIGWALPENTQQLADATSVNMMLKLAVRIVDRRS
mmetsp:Transcript_85446/g.151079  ORF Transcript_85446/g.151079 Transcript_85446/m.151079 type:complete len:241 (+) Transcript_85446:1162-1884(+)